MTIEPTKAGNLDRFTMRARPESLRSKSGALPTVAAGSCWRHGGKSRHSPRRGGSVPLRSKSIGSPRIAGLSVRATGRWTLLPCWHFTSPCAALHGEAAEFPPVWPGVRFPVGPRRIILLVFISSIGNDTGMAIKQTLGDQLRDAIRKCNKTRYRISMETGIEQSALSRFVNGTAGLGLENIDLLAECIGARLVVDAKPKSKTKRKS